VDLSKADTYFAGFLPAIIKKTSQGIGSKCLELKSRIFICLHLDYVANG